MGMWGAKLADAAAFLTASRSEQEFSWDKCTADQGFAGGLGGEPQTIEYEKRLGVPAATA
jgi:hypothetical protein